MARGRICLAAFESQQRNSRLLHWQGVRICIEKKANVNATYVPAPVLWRGMAGMLWFGVHIAIAILPGSYGTETCRQDLFRA